MNTDYELLVVKEKMWADMLMEVLKDNHIPCTALPVHGARMTLKTGIQEKLKIYVPSENKVKAEELLSEIFPKCD